MSILYFGGVGFEGVSVGDYYVGNEGKVFKKHEHVYMYI